jgi:hypothetical protein
MKPVSETEKTKYVLVGDTGIEPVASSVSGKRSPAELIARDAATSGRFSGPAHRHAQRLPEVPH